MKPMDMQEKLIFATIGRSKNSPKTVDKCNSPDRKLPINTPNSARIIRKVFTETGSSSQPIDGNKILVNRRSLVIEEDSKNPGAGS